MREERNLSPRVHPDDRNRVEGLKAMGSFIDAKQKTEPLSYYTPILIQCTLPHSDPKTASWHRKNGDFSLTVASGYDSDGKTYGVPYGSFPRLVLSHIITQVIKTKDKHVEFGESLTGFLREIGYTGNLRGSTTRAAKTIRDQMLRLITASIQFQRRGGTAEAGRLAGVNINIADQYDLWWDFKKPEQDSLWGPAGAFEQEPTVLNKYWYYKYLSSEICMGSENGRFSCQEAQCPLACRSAPENPTKKTTQGLPGPQRLS